MTQKIYRTKRYAVVRAVVCFLWMYLATTLLNHESLSELPVIIKLEGVLNISLLIMMMGFVRCLILLFKKRPLLQAGENGLYLQVSKKNRGIVPWRHITHFEYSQDQRHIRVYLQGMWDILDGCGERFDIQIDENGKRMIVLPLRHKVRDLEHIRDELQEWLFYYSDAEKVIRPDMDEAYQRRTAAIRKQGLGAILVPLYFLRSKFWILLLIAYLFFAALVEAWTTFSRPVVLGISAVPVLLFGILLRIFLLKVIALLERSKERNQERMVGL